MYTDYSNSKKKERRQGRDSEVLKAYEVWPTAVIQPLSGLFTYPLGVRDLAIEVRDLGRPNGFWEEDGLWARGTGFVLIGGEGSPGWKLPLFQCFVLDETVKKDKKYEDFLLA